MNMEMVCDGDSLTRHAHQSFLPISHGAYKPVACRSTTVGGFGPEAYNGYSSALIKYRPNVAQDRLTNRMFFQTVGL